MNDVRTIVKHTIPIYYSTNFVANNYQMNSVTVSGKTLRKRQRNQWKVKLVSEIFLSDKSSVSSGSFSERM